ncbi:hypothetical protein Tco_0377051 [Tanacetum coccineum]
MVLLRMRGYGEGGDEDVVTVGVGGRLWWPDIWPDVDAGKNGKGERRWESIISGNIINAEGKCGAHYRKTGALYVFNGFIEFDGLFLYAM